MAERWRAWRPVALATLFAAATSLTLYALARLVDRALPGLGPTLDAVPELLAAVLLYDVTATASVVELAWTLTALLGLVRYLARYYRTRAARARLRRSGRNGVLALTNQGRGVRFMSLVICFECMTALGLAALLLPPNPAARSDPLLLVGPFCLFTMQVTLIVKGEVLDRNDRHIATLYQYQQPGGGDDAPPHPGD